MTRNPTLVPHLVPRTLWGVNAHRRLPKREWTKIREDAIARAQGCCPICEAELLSPECDEIWDYDDALGMATLVGVQAICPNCHLASHVGRARAAGLERDAVAHLCRVNGITAGDAATMVRKALVVWAKRGERTWAVHVSGPLLVKFPALSRLVSSVSE